MDQNKEWRICIDFGTAASKVCVSRVPQHQRAEALQIYPLRLGEFMSGSDTYLAPTSVLFNGGRILLGQHALSQLDNESCTTDPLLSFKTVLGAHDIQDALELHLPRSICPTSSYTYRDALVLYIASVLVLSECSLKVQTNLNFDVYRAVGRYTYPLWRPGAQTHEIMVQLFCEAGRVAELIGEHLISSLGVDEEMARNALTRAHASPVTTLMVHGVFEALAAAEAHLLFNEDFPDHVLVFDMGAGTTDISGFSRVNGAFEERRAARRTLPIACDDIDRILVGMLCDRAAEIAPNDRQAQVSFWRRTSARSRKLKQHLFENGSCEAQFQKTRIVIKLSEVERDQQFKKLMTAIQRGYRAALDSFCEKIPAREPIGLILAGGGSFLTPVVDVMKSTRAQNRRARRITVLPVVPTWASDSSFEGKLAPVFPQMAISIGGSLAQISGEVTAKSV